MNTQTIHTIPDHWDTLGIITANSVASSEYRVWRERAATSSEWVGDELTEADFEAWIESLKDDLYQCQTCLHSWESDYEHHCPKCNTLAEGDALDLTY